MPLSRKLVLAERPDGSIAPGKTFKIETEEAPDLANGQLLLRTLYWSVDPAMRARIREDVDSYISPLGIGQVLQGSVIAEVVASDSTMFQPGRKVTAFAGWSEMAVVDEDEVHAIDAISEDRLTDMLGVLGAPGLTAYFGMLQVGEVKAGDLVVVSSAAGAVGSVAVQIAKLSGATVLGLAGSDEKCRWLKELGVDAALNYKESAFEEKFEKAARLPLLFGGPILDLALSRAALHARFVVCGGLSQYNAAIPYGVKNTLNLISRRIRMEGFLLYDYAHDYPTARRQLVAWIAEGKVHSRETIIPGGIDALEGALLALFEGSNTGKLLVSA